MNKNIYANSDEKFVKATVLFSSENKIYYDEACTEEVTLEDALNLFKKGLMLVSVDGGFKRPTGINVTEDGYEISYGGEGGGSESAKVVEIELTMGEGESTFTVTVDGIEAHYEEVKDLYLGGNCRFVVFMRFGDENIQLDAIQPVLNASSKNMSVFGINPDEDGVALIQIVIGENAEYNHVNLYVMSLADE